MTPRQKRLAWGITISAAIFFWLTIDSLIALYFH